MDDRPRSYAQIIKDNIKNEVPKIPGDYVRNEIAYWKFVLFAAIFLPFFFLLTGGASILRFLFG